MLSAWQSLWLNNPVKISLSVKTIPKIIVFSSNYFLKFLPFQLYFPNNEIHRYRNTKNGYNKLLTNTYCNFDSKKLAVLYNKIKSIRILKATIAWKCFGLKIQLTKNKTYYQTKFPPKTTSANIFPKQKYPYFLKPIEHVAEIIQTKVEQVLLQQYFLY